MLMQTSIIISQAREILSDKSVDRWSDDRLIRLLNNACLHLAVTTILFQEEGYVRLVDQQQQYDLSEDAIKILRVEYLGKPLGFKYHSEMDMINSAWTTRVATVPTNVIVDKQKEGTFKLYPRVENDNTDNIDFGGNYGIIVAIEYTDIPLEVEADMDVEVDPQNYIKVYYCRKPLLATELTDNIDLPEFAVEAVAHYIAGMALRDNQDSQNRSMSAEELQLYGSFVEEYKLEKAKNFAYYTSGAGYNPIGS